MNTLLAIEPEIRDTIAAGGPVVALESTLIAHGMPYPHNLDTARRLMQIIRKEGAVPALIAINRGRILVGVSETDLQQIAEARDVSKISRRDIPAAIVAGGLAATTVASTMFCASLAGIRIFATGGIGGVHRGADHTFDVSADLDELARTPVAVVSAGAKAILDLPKTLEYLETRGVPVVGYGTDEFPAFFSVSSGLRLSARCDTPEEAAALLVTQDTLGFSSGLVIANPIPREHAIPFEEIDTLIEKAVVEAGRSNVRGKAVTPYLLQKLVEWTGGRSLAANMALVEHNARIGAAIAVAYSRRRAMMASARGATTAPDHGADI
jgi:pseudouridine-5'-phosphate glycosidase